MTKQFILFTLFCCALCGCEEKDDTKSLHETYFKQAWKLTGLNINGTSADLSARGLTEILFFL